MANRSQRRKTKEKKYQEDTENIKTTIITLAVVVIVFVLFYFITVAINNKNRKLNTNKAEDKEVEIQYNEILGESTFSMKPSTYYVMFYDFNGSEAVYYEYMYSKYSSKERVYIYKVDLSNGFNKKFLSDNANPKANSASELKLKDGTLIKIVDGKNVLYIDENSQAILKELNSN